MRGQMLCDSGLQVISASVNIYCVVKSEWGGKPIVIHSGHEETHRCPSAWFYLPSQHAAVLVTQQEPNASVITRQKSS
ncbi:hypothetical protein TNIN_269521 [Trichonephila inaurata madagascariensis]|uniref:Uncharacterized protein n=1 Tax=Trichonephila inaurata madagascariensis TaxID=2747483 RepID=A0A8X7C2E1_9ARAC|nr:hypothetical protein TNIN_269521 [Trichonephila inaurata madagascariensis]